MINYSITARAVNPNLFEVKLEQRSVLAKAKAEGSQPASKDSALVESVVLHFFATPQYADLGALFSFPPKGGSWRGVLPIFQMNQ